MEAGGYTCPRASGRTGLQTMQQLSNKYLIMMRMCTSRFQTSAAFSHSLVDLGFHLSSRHAKWTSTTDMVLHSTTTVNRVIEPREGWAIVGRDLARSAFLVFSFG